MMWKKRIESRYRQRQVGILIIPVGDPDNSTLFQKNQERRNMAKKKGEHFA